MFLDGFRAAPGWMTVVTAMLVVGSVASTCYPLGYRLLVDGALGHSPARVAWGVAIVGGLISLGWMLSAIGATEAMILSDHISVYRTGKLIELISGVHGMEHLERPDYLTEVERLHADRRQLAAAPRQLLSNIATVARIVAFLVLLLTVSPWLLLLPLCAVPPLVADRFAKRVTKRAQNEMAHTKRLAGLIFGLTSDVGSAGEVRSYGLGRVPGRRASAPVRQSWTSAVRARPCRCLAVQGTGWVLYAAGLMGAIAFVAVRASDGAHVDRHGADGGFADSPLAHPACLGRAGLWCLWSRPWPPPTGCSGSKTTRPLKPPAPALARRPEKLRDGIAFHDVTFRYPGTERAVLEEPRPCNCQPARRSRWSVRTVRARPP